MPTVKRVRVKGLTSKFRVTLYAKEGTYALSVPKTRLGYLLLPIARAHPFEVRLKTPVTVDVPRGVKPVGKAARRSFKYVPLRPGKKNKKKTATPVIDEVTSAVAAAANRNRTNRNRTKKAVATAA